MNILGWMKENDMSEDEAIEIASAVKSALENLGYIADVKISRRGLRINIYKRV